MSGPLTITETSRLRPTQRIKRRCAEYRLQFHICFKIIPPVLLNLVSLLRTAPPLSLMLIRAEARATGCLLLVIRVNVRCKKSKWTGPNVGKYDRRGLMLPRMAIFIFHHEHLSADSAMLRKNAWLLGTFLLSPCSRKCLQDDLYSTPNSKDGTRHHTAIARKKEICPYLANIWIIFAAASQFTIYMVCFTRRIIIQRPEFSQLSLKFPEKRGVVAILCSEQGVTIHQWELSTAPCDQ